MKKLPTIELERIVLRPFTLEDAKIVQELAGDKEIAKMTLNIPYPYEDGMAEEWISSHQDLYNKDKSVSLAIVHEKDRYLIGAISIMLNRNHDKGELGYWIGRRYWNMGYCSEAGEAIIRYGFEELNLNRIYAYHLKKNPASGKVMEKIGMKYEGELRQDVKKWGEFEDLACYGILKDEYFD